MTQSSANSDRGALVVAVNGDKAVVLTDNGALTEAKTMRWACPGGGAPSYPRSGAGFCVYNPWRHNQGAPVWSRGVISV